MSSIRMGSLPPPTCLRHPQSSPDSHGCMAMPPDSSSFVGPLHQRHPLSLCLIAVRQSRPSTGKPHHQTLLLFCSMDMGSAPKEASIKTFGEEQTLNSEEPNTEQNAERVRRFPVDNPTFLKNLQETRVLSPLEAEMMQKLMKFKVTHESPMGRLVIRALRTEQFKDLEQLLTDSYADVMWGPFTYRPVLKWILARYLRDRQASLPHAVTLVGLCAPLDDTAQHQKWFLVGAVEISFDAEGQAKDVLTPVPPQDAPFLSNMAVDKKFRRQGIGSQLLKAAEQLAAQMGCTEIYLHCRLIDHVPLSMYKKAGYDVVATDSILTLLMLQPRRHLMRKSLFQQEIMEQGDQVS